MAEDSKPIEVHPGEHEPVDPNQRDENVSVLMPSPPDPQADKPTNHRQDEAKQSGKPLTLDFKWTTDLIAILALVISVFSVGFSYLTVVEMRETNRLTSENLVVSERPWLSAEMRVIQDLTFDGESGIGSLGVEVILHNSGKTPALNARVGQFFFAGYMDKTQTLLQQEISCGRFRSEWIDSRGDVIFPGDSHRIDEMSYLDKNQIEAALKHNLNVGYGSKITPSLITCIEYRSSLGVKHHQTRYFSIVGPRWRFGLTAPLDPVGIHKDTQLWRFIYGQYAD